MARHRLLLVEDSPTDRLRVAGALAADPLGDYEIIEVDRLADAVGHLADGTVDLILLDLSLPDSSGEDTYRRARAAAPDLPIVVCTDDDDEALGLRLLRKGADELLVKGAAVESLRRAVRQGIERAAARRWLSQREQLVRVDRLLALGTLVGGVAHEINNPTHAILLSAQLLGKAWQDIQPLLDGHFRDDPDARLGNVAYSEVRTWIPEVIADIQNATERIKSIVAALRDYAREERESAAGSVDLNQVVRSALVLLSNRLKQATRAFSVEYGSGLPAIRGKTRRLEQVVVGLVMNACDALDSVEQAIRLATHYDEQTGRVTLLLEDQGRGIPADDLTHVTDPFFTTRRSGGRTGLGLAIVHRIVDEHGGSLSFESEVGRGTRVCLSLPAASEERT